jgi:hypothetical protein
MGLLSAPLDGLLFIFREIADRAEAELNDDGPIRDELMELYKCLEAKTVSEEDFSRRETELVLRLEAIESRQKRRQGHGTH